MNAEDVLLVQVKAIYEAMLKAMVIDRGHCYEVSEMARVVAVMLGMNNTILCRGTRFLEPDTKDFHGWLLLPSGAILHSPARGLVEMRFPKSGEFEALWQAGG